MEEPEERDEPEYLGAFAYAGAVDKLMIDSIETHMELIEAMEDEYDITLDRNWAFGWLYEDDRQTNLYVQWSSVEYYPGDRAVRERAEKALEREFNKPVKEVEGLSQWNDGETYAKVTRFKPKKPRRPHVKKRHIDTFYGYDGYAMFIPSWCPPVHPEGGQVDTTAKTGETRQLQLPVVIKFVSLPNRFLVGENTHHVYLLEAEFGADTFPADTAAIGRAWLEDDKITDVGFDYGTPSGQAYAIQQLTKWAEQQGYEIDPTVGTMTGLAKSS